MKTWPSVQVTPFQNTKDVYWQDGKPRCSRHRGVALVPGSAIRLTPGRHYCAMCMREARAAAR